MKIYTYNGRNNLCGQRVRTARLAKSLTQQDLAAKLQTEGIVIERDSVSLIWGWGKVNALAAVNEALAHVDIQQADEKWFSKSLQLYPNPATSQVTVLTGRHTPETVSIYSVEGRLMMSQEVVMESSIDISRLPHGVYIVKCGARNARLVH